MASADNPASSPAAPAANVPDACTFISRAELETAVGWELREGKSKTAAPGSYECSFTHPPDAYVTRNFPNPALPKEIDFNSITVHTDPSEPKDFEEGRKMIGTEAIDAPGVGDAAYFYGSNLLYVRVGSRGFSLRLYTNAQTEADKAKLREVLTNLGKMGAAKLK